MSDLREVWIACERYSRDVVRDKHTGKVKKSDEGRGHKMTLSLYRFVKSDPANIDVVADYLPKNRR